MKKTFSFLKQLLLNKWTKRTSFIGLIILAFIIICDQWIVYSTKKQLFSSIATMPNNEVGLLLGTSKHTKGGHVNLFFKYRIKAAADLWMQGKIKHIIVSGDNHIESYDEPSDMRDALIEAGVPADCITLDYAGFRTLDSVVRCFKVFGQKKFTIISQSFHNERALFIANNTEGVEAVAFNANNVEFRYHPMTFVREFAARVKCVLDIFVLHTQPKFLGKPEKIIIKN